MQAVALISVSVLAATVAARPGLQVESGRTNGGWGLLKQTMQDGARTSPRAQARQTFHACHSRAGGDLQSVQDCTNFLPLPEVA